MSDPNALFDQIAEDVAQAMDRAGGEIVKAVQADLSVPVQTTRGPRGGLKKVRSKPGERPRKESGNLQAGVTHSVVRDGVNASLVIDDPVSYAVPLEVGKNRPILAPVPDEHTDDVLDAIVEAFNGESTT